MGRGVSNLSYAETVIHFTADWINEYNEDTEEYDYSISQENWEDFFDNLKCEIQSKLKSYEEIEEWEGENLIFLQNSLCNIAISEYMGCYSLSVAPRMDLEYQKESLALNHASKIRNTLEKCLEKSVAKILRRLGTFSNGNSVYEYKK